MKLRNKKLFRFIKNILHKLLRFVYSNKIKNFLQVQVLIVGLKFGIMLINKNLFKLKIHNLFYVLI